MIEERAENTWPPENVGAYFGSPSFLSYVYSECESLRRRYPSGAEDAVFDAVADVMVRVCSDHPTRRKINLEDFPSEARFLAYVSAICRWRVIDERRKAQRETQVESAFLESIPVLDEQSDLSAIDVREAIDKSLPEPERQAILLFLRGLTQRDVAKVLGVSDARVSVILKSARDRIRKHFNTE